MDAIRWRAASPVSTRNDVLFGKPEPKKKRRLDRVDPADAEYVFTRDRECVIAKLERWGWLTPRKPCSGRDTIEHVLRFAGRRVHGRTVMVRACLSHNVDGECSRQRHHIRAYLALVEPDRMSEADAHRP
jgi:hypothetical protein